MLNPAVPTGLRGITAQVAAVRRIRLTFFSCLPLHFDEIGATDHRMSSGGILLHRTNEQLSGNQALLPAPERSPAHKHAIQTTSHDGCSAR
jgi:hypothetical protein